MDKDSNRLRLGIAGMSHSHVAFLLRGLNRAPREQFQWGSPDDVEIVGIAEPDQDVVARFAGFFGFDRGLAHTSLDVMLDKARPEAVVAFGPIFDHVSVVEACAPRGIHVMVEKPLAVSVAHAERIASLAREHGIQVLTNYETTWYATTAACHRRVIEERRLGNIRKIVAHDGHKGPAALGVPPEFLAWLTDPVKNGGGAMNDFGCYGINLITQLMGNTQPLRVTAVTRQIDTARYSAVEDDSIVILEYPKACGIVQGSWSWPFPRKDLQIYGDTGYVDAVDGQTLRFRYSEADSEQTDVLAPLPAPYHDPFTYLRAVVRGQVEVTADSLSSLENNLVVVKTLEAARESSRSGKSINLDY